MLKPVIRHTLLVLALGSGIAWGFTSHKYDCFNIGPCRGDVDFWIKLGDIAGYSFLGSWAALVMISALHSRQAKGVRARVVLLSLAILLPLASIYGASCFFNLGVKVPAI